MTNTTPAAICAAFEALVVGLTPSGGTSVGSKSAYALIDEVDYQEDPETEAMAELDRQIQIHEIEPVEFRIEGMSTHNVITGQFDMVIGHQNGNYRDMRDRRDKDLQQLVAQVTHLDNKPAGVHRTYFGGMEAILIREGTYFWTTLRFGIVYAVAADYGG